jgi:hypothetical protein
MACSDPISQAARPSRSGAIPAQVGGRRIAFRPRVRNEDRLALALARLRLCPIFGENATVAEFLSPVAGLPFFEQGEVSVKGPRQKDSLVMGRVLHRRDEIALGYSVGAQEMGGFIRTTQRWRSEDDTCPQDGREQDEDDYRVIGAAHPTAGYWIARMEIENENQWYQKRRGGRYTNCRRS